MELRDRMSRLEGAYEQVDKRLDDLNQAIDGLGNRLNTMNQIMVGGFIALLVAVIGLYFAQ